MVKYSGFLLLLLIARDLSPRVFSLSLSRLQLDCRNANKTAMHTKNAQGFFLALTSGIVFQSLFLLL